MDHKANENVVREGKQGGVKKHLSITFVRRRDFLDDDRIKLPSRFLCQNNNPNEEAKGDCL